MTLKLAFIGAGELAQPYLQALGKRADVEIVAVCDQNRRAAEQTAVGWGARVFLDYQSLVNESALDAVWICLPPRMQGDVMLHVAEAHVPFFVETPGALDFNTARLCHQRVQKAGLVTAVGYHSQYSDVVAEAREYLGTNSIPMALGWWLCPPQAHNQVNTASDLLWCEACRLVDGLRFFCGEVTRVRALSAGGDAADGGMVVQFEFATGTVGMLTCATFARPQERIELEMLGEGWSLHLGKDFSRLQLDEYDKSTILRCLNQPHSDLANLFLEAVQRHDMNAVAPSYANAFRTMAVCEAARISIHEGRPITIDEIEIGPLLPPPSAQTDAGKNSKED